MPPARQSKGLWLEAGGRIATLFLAALLGGLIALPVVAIVFRVNPGVVLQQLGDPGVRQSLILSLITIFSATVVSVVLGLPIAAFLDSRSFPGSRLIEVR